MEGGTGPDLQKSEPKARFDPVTGKPLGSEGIGPAGVASASSPMDENDGRVVEDVPPKIGMGAKILNIFVEPSSVFKNLYYYNDWLTPLVFAGALTIVGSLISKPYNDEAGRQFKELMKVPTTGAAETVGNITSYVTLALVPVGLMIGWLIAAGVLFILGSFMLENVDFKKLYSIAAFSSMPVAFTHIVNAIAKFGQTPVIQSYDDFIAPKYLGRYPSRACSPPKGCWEKCLRRTTFSRSGGTGFFFSASPSLYAIARSKPQR